MPELPADPDSTQSKAATPPELEEVLDAFPGLGGATVAVLEQGLIHSSFTVDSGGHAYILQRLNSAFSSDIHCNIAAVTQHLMRRGVSTLELVETRAGGLFMEESSGARWRLMTRMPGAAFDRCESEAQASSAATLVADFHTALSDFEGELLPIGFAFHDMPLHLRELQAALRTHSAHPLYSEVAKLSEAVNAALRDLGEPADLPRRVIHGDLKFNNILFEGEGVEERQRASTLIDLDTVGRMPLYIEMGDLWRSWCNRGASDSEAVELDLTIFRASAQAYLDALGFVLERAELASLAEGIDRICVELSARFAADALNQVHWSWDPDRFESAGHHHLSRAKGQLELYRQARETRAERAGFLLG